MKLLELFSETFQLIGLELAPIDEKIESIEIHLTGYPILNLEKLPEEELLVISGVFCRYMDTDNLAHIFESLLNLHAYGFYTQGAFFAANSETEQIILHKIIPLSYLSSQELASLITIFAQTLNTIIESWKQGELDSLCSAYPLSLSSPLDTVNLLRI